MTVVVILLSPGECTVLQTQTWKKNEGEINANFSNTITLVSRGRFNLEALRCRQHAVSL